MYGMRHFLLKDRNTVFHIKNGVEWQYSFLYAYQIQINKYVVIYAKVRQIGEECLVFGYVTGVCP